MGKYYQCIQCYGPSFMTKFCSALYLENLLSNIFAKLNLRGGVSCMPAALLFLYAGKPLKDISIKHKTLHVYLHSGINNQEKIKAYCKRWWPAGYLSTG